MSIYAYFSEQIDLLRLVLHLRDRLKKLSKENAEIASKLVGAIEAAETAKRQLVFVCVLHYGHFPNHNII